MYTFEALAVFVFKILSPGSDHFYGKCTWKENTRPTILMTKNDKVNIRQMFSELHALSFLKV